MPATNQRTHKCPRCRHPWQGPGILSQWQHKCQQQIRKTHPTGHYHKIPGPSQEWQLSNISNIIRPSVLHEQKGWKPSTKDAQHWKSKITSSQLERKFEHSMNFCSYVLLSEKSKHPLNTTRANDTVIPGQDQGSYPNDSTMPAANQRHILQTIIIRFLIPARNDNLAT